MDRSTPWRLRIARRIESWIGLAALAGSAWMFSTMSEATTTAAQGVPPQSGAPEAPRTAPPTAAATAAPSPTGR
jgi:hypothetical protein